jgi:hypothetical protein
VEDSGGARSPAWLAALFDPANNVPAGECERAGLGAREGGMASGRGLASLPSEGDEIPSRIAIRGKYRLCWIEFLVGFLFF